MELDGLCPFCSVFLFVFWACLSCIVLLSSLARSIQVQECRLHTDVQFCAPPANLNDADGR